MLCTMLDKNPTTATLDAFNDAVSKTNVGDYASVVLGSAVRNICPQHRALVLGWAETL